MPEMKVRIETLSRNLVVVRGLTVNYDQTPAEAKEELLHDNLFIASDYPQALWNGGKSGIVEGVNIPIYLPHKSFSTSEGRQLQSEIGYGLPVELAALRDERIRKPLWDMSIWWIVALAESNEALWPAPSDNHWPVYLNLLPYGLAFFLSYAGGVWGSTVALVGAPQVP